MTKLLGVPLKPLAPEPLVTNAANDPGFGWRLSDQARREIDRIERHTVRAFPTWRFRP